MLDVRRLWILREVSRRGSFTAAAQALAYTPSAISQQIAAFERELGTRLVERGARGVSLTEPGRLLVSQAESVFHQLDSIEKELRAFAGLESGLLRLGWFATAGSTLVARSIAAFRVRYPGIELDLFQGDPDECVAGLRAGEINLALVYQFEMEPPLPDDIEQLDLVDDPLHIGLPLGHPLADRDSIGLADLAGEHWIQGVRHGPTLEVLPEACREVGFEPVVALRTDDRTVVEGLVAAGAGVALIPQLTVPTVRTDVVVRPLDTKALSRKIRVALAPASYRSPAALAMLSVLKSVCAELKDEAARRLTSGRGRTE
ncbi:LysR substrate-binding domain-containing protein [Actinoallomurus sp. NBC_01490]|uniref:LysR family transcriptional regulator n=1 Tax=Actinoallomurus sp. NBC_01490 TaxID=2903557 RepID=UPI002E33E86A|nr:LysR substrate-binding domain-containing protein [Actinoallomurus sp. NBC_01490]